LFKQIKRASNCSRIRGGVTSLTVLSQRLSQPSPEASPDHQELITERDQKATHSRNEGTSNAAVSYADIQVPPAARKSSRKQQEIQKGILVIRKVQQKSVERFQGILL
jgi:hypothetical protein